MRMTLSFPLSSMLLLVGCSGDGSGGAPGKAEARLSLDGSTYKLRDVSMTLETGEDPWFRIEGEPVGDSNEDCVTGLSGGMGLYGDLPASVDDASDLVGQRLKVDFTGDGDDANFCFVGMGGLAGAEDAWVQIDSVDGDRVTFTMTGTFKIYDENGEGPVKTASAKGAAIVHRES